MVALFSAIISVFNAVPYLKGIFDQFVVFYLQWEQANREAHLRETLRDVIVLCDQRELEAEGTSGAPSNHAGTRTRPRSGK